MPAGQQIALQPALALVLAEHLHHPAVGRHVVVDRAGSRPSNSGRSPRTPRSSGWRPVSSGLKTRKLRASALSFITSRMNCALDARGLGLDRPRRGHLDRVVAEIGHPQIAQQQPAVGVRVGAHAALALRGQLGQLRPQAARRRRKAPPAGSSSSTVRGSAMCSGLSMSPIGTWCARNVPSTGWPSTPSARSSPWACGGRSSASAGRSPEIPCCRASFWIRLISAIDLVQRRGHQLVHRRPGSVAFDEIGRVAVAAERGRRVPRGRSAPARSGRRSCSR